MKAATKARAMRADSTASGLVKAMVTSREPRSGVIRV